MPVPKRKTSKHRRDRRSAGKHIVQTSSASCQNCEAPVLQHSACMGCGYYRGIKVLRTKEERVSDREVAKKMRETSLEESAAAKKAEAQKRAEKAAKAMQEAQDAEQNKDK